MFLHIEVMLLSLLFLFFKFAINQMTTIIEYVQKRGSPEKGKIFKVRIREQPCPSSSAAKLAN